MQQCSQTHTPVTLQQKKRRGYQLKRQWADFRVGLGVVALRESNLTPAPVILSRH